ncbi:MAG: dihydropyrimidinase [Gemmatimonadota bacterium]|nr:MAG: dihydropyrimidinase [Gemmatimonadota bacterium]
MEKGWTLIRGGQVVRGGTVSRQDVLFQGERIAAIGELSDSRAAVVIDADGLLVLPGAVDTHVHLNDVFMGTVSVHDYYTGTRAAAYGGVTSIVDFSNQVPGGALARTLEDKREEASGMALVDWGVHPVITEPNQATLDQIPYVVAAGAPTIKCYMTYREDGLLTEDEDLKKIAVHLGEAGGMLMLHAEDNDMIEENVPRLIEQGKTAPIYHARSKPPEVETEAIRRIVGMAEETGARFFVVHLASADGLDLITGARERGLRITAETCTHYLIFTDEMLEREDGIKWICSPPLRDAETQDRLWMALGDDRIAMVSSDDAAYSWEAKLLGVDRFDRCPNGIPGIEPRFHLLYSEGVAKGRLTLPRFVEIVSTAPANLFGLAPRKGSLAVGADADIILFDPEARWTMGGDTLHMATDWSAYEDIEMVGRILKVFSRGELIVDGEECMAEKGRGRYIHRTLLDPRHAAG